MKNILIKGRQGLGKTTMAKALRNEFEAQGLKVVILDELSLISSPPTGEDCDVKIMLKCTNDHLLSVKEWEE